MSFQQVIEEVGQCHIGCAVATSPNHPNWTIWAWKGGRPTISGQVRCLTDAWMWLNQEVLHGYIPLGEPGPLDEVLERLKDAHIPHGLAVLADSQLMVWLGDDGKRPSQVVKSCREAAKWLDGSARKHYASSKYTAA
jgi:hypothetical protein